MRWRKAALVGLVVLNASTVLASTFVKPDPDRFLERANVVAVGTIEAIESVDTADGLRTEITLLVEDGIRGAVAGERVTFREIGGQVGSRTLVLDGSPPYRVGERVLAVLRFGKDRALHTAGMQLGRVPLAKPLPEGVNGRAAVAPNEGELGDWQRSLAEKAAALPRREQQSAGRTMSAPEPLEGARESRDSFRFMGARWRANPVKVVDAATGDAKLGNSASDAMIAAGRATWNQAGAALVLEPDGKAPGRGFVCEPGKLLVSFEDPKSEVDDPDNCSGVLAIGGFCSDGVTQPDGQQSIVGGALVFNNGWGGCGFWTPCNAAEIAVHELGHSIGLAHTRDQGQASSVEERDSTMFWTAHFDGRCAGTRDLDRQAVRALYGASPAATVVPLPSPSPTRSPSPTATEKPKPEPSPTMGVGPKGCGKGGTVGLFVLGAGAILFRRRARRYGDPATMP